MRVRLAEDQEAKEYPVDDEETYSCVVIASDRDGDVFPPAVLDEMVDRAVVEPFFVVETPYILPAMPAIDKSWVGQVLTFTVKNETQAMWEKCYPGAFWVKWDERMPGSPATKDECLGNIVPGASVTFRVVVPIFPDAEKPDALRIAVLEDGICWHMVEDVKVR